MAKIEATMEIIDLPPSASAEHEPDVTEPKSEPEPDISKSKEDTNAPGTENWLAAVSYCLLDELVYFRF